MQKKLGIFLVKSALLTAGMGAAIHLFFNYLSFAEASRFGKLAILLATISLGVVVYLGLNLLFNRQEVRGLRHLFSRK